MGFTPEESHLIQIVELLGQFPRDSVKAGKNAQKWFYDDGTYLVKTISLSSPNIYWNTFHLLTMDNQSINQGSLRLDTTYYHVSLKDILEMRIEGPEVAPTSEFLGAMLRWSPYERARAEDLVNHPWFDNLDT